MCARSEKAVTAQDCIKFIKQQAQTLHLVGGLDNVIDQD